MNEWITSLYITLSYFSQTNLFQDASLANCNISQLCSREGKRYLDFLHASQRLIETYLQSWSFILYLQTPSTGCSYAWEAGWIKKRSRIKWGGPNLRDCLLLCSLSLLLHHFRPAVTLNVNFHTGTSHFTHPVSNLWVISRLTVRTHVTSLFF